MTHSPEKLKQLAEFAAEFVGLTKEFYKVEDGRKIYIWDYPRDGYGPTTAIGEHLYDRELAKEVFEEAETAPILMHLGKREMEKRGFKITSANNLNCADLNATYVWSATNDIHDDSPKQFLDNNEFLAFWLAVEQAAGG